MKVLVRYFFKGVRLVVGPMLLLWEKITTPRGVQRPPEVQWKIDRQCREFTLYQFRTCPFCLKVRRAIRALSLNIDLRDVQYNSEYRTELLNGGGQIKVPCLRIIDSEGRPHWVYESALIIQYLRQRFG